MNIVILSELLSDIFRVKSEKKSLSNFHKIIREGRKAWSSSVLPVAS